MSGELCGEERRRILAMGAALMPAACEGVDVPGMPAYMAPEHRLFVERWSETHDFDFCAIHGPWKLGPKKGGLFIATCPGCCRDAEAAR